MLLGLGRLVVMYLHHTSKEVRNKRNARKQEGDGGEREGFKDVHDQYTERISVHLAC